jgi:nitrile hydratase subunit beta
VNGIHDLGGLHGFGAIAAERDEPPFHEMREGGAAAMVDIMTVPPGFTVDRFRYLRETLRPDLYLTQSYYEQWLYMAEQAMLEAGMISAGGLARGKAKVGSGGRNDAVRADVVWNFLHDRGNSSRALSGAPRFAIGQRVRARNVQPEGHTRLPRYARGRLGLVTHHHDGHVFPDASAHGKGDAPKHLYTVAFTARELWGAAANTRDTVNLDLWESYLEPA